MKNSAKIITIVLTLLTISCRKHSDPTEVPSCVNELITKMKALKAGNPAGQVVQYDYNGKTVYYIPSDTCCDTYSYLYDSNCNLICNPNGGITGNGNGQCPDFFKNRKNEKLIWQDDRK